MLDKEEFKKSPRFAELTAKAEAVLDTDPDYIQAVSERKKARDWYRDMENQFEECDEEMAQAELDEAKAEDKMHSIEKKIIYNLISDPEEAEAVYYYY